MATPLLALEIEVEAAMICYQNDKAAHTCRMKQAALHGGPTSQRLARVSANALADGLIGCAIG